VGSALLDAGIERVRELRCDAVRSRVEGTDASALRFAARSGFVEVDREVELVRPLRPREPASNPPPGVELAEVPPGARDGLRTLVVAGVADMPVVGGLSEGFADELMDELREALLVVTAVADGACVGLAGLQRHGARTAALAHTITTVLPPYRGRGIARALKVACAHWAAGMGYDELVTWTQVGNDAMQAVNEATGFERGNVSVTVEAPTIAPT
jgi:GNAT superfamily N-acetyltransferase